MFRAPPPLRSRLHPRGFPKLARAQVASSNRLVDFTIKLLEAQVANGPKHMVVLEHPEDLGRRQNGAAPASIWQWPAVQALETKMGVCSGALYQCDEADAPTDDRALGEKLLVVGPPQMDEQGNCSGPLQKRDWQGPEMIGKASRSFGTRGSEAWPRELCQAIASSACAELASDLDAKGPKAGEVAAVRDACLSVPAATPQAASSGPREVERRPRR